jgi:hypothetical protein
MSAPRIASARVIGAQSFGDMAKVLVKTDADAEEEKLFDFFDDELSFRPEEFIGLTVEEGRQLFYKKDVAYLRS